MRAIVRVRSCDFVDRMKSRLRDVIAEKDSEVDDYMARFRVRSSRHQILQESLRLELDAIVKAYALAGTQLWDEAAELLARTRTIYVVGFQASKGLALDFASRLLWARPNVIFVDNASGTFGEIIAADPKHSLVILVDTAAYATRGIKLAEHLKARETAAGDCHRQVQPLGAQPIPGLSSRRTPM